MTNDDKTELIPTSRQTLKVELLHLIEDRESRGEATWVRDLVAATEKSETTVRKAVNELLDGGFIERVPNATTQLRTVRKNQEPKPEPKSAADEAEAPTNGRGRPLVADVQARDERVLGNFGPGGATVEELANALDLDRKAVYLSVWRLSRAGKIVKTGRVGRAPVWAKVTA